MIVQTQKNHLQEICAAIFPEIIGPKKTPMKYAQLQIVSSHSIFEEFSQLPNKHPSKAPSDVKT